MLNLYRQNLKTTIIAAAFCVLHASTSFAGGPLIIGGSDKITPITYQNSNIVLNVESGTLGALSNAQANAILLDAFNQWNMVGTSSINLSIDTTKINADINIDNYDSYIPNTAGTIFNAEDGLNPVVYDNKGEIIDELLGIGQSDSTIGLAASVFTDSGDYFLEGYIIINGRDDLGQPEEVVKLTITHEIGHFFGIDHSQLNINNQERFSGFPALCRTSSPSDYPVMYPYICRDTVSLHGDDISTVSALYPAANIDNEFGILQGYFVDANGRAILGANLWLEDDTGKAFSIVSDYLKQCTGYYKIYLPAGKYTLHANSINTLFYGGSGVGPYSEETFSESFLSPHPITEVTVQDGSSGNPLVIDISTNLTTEISFDLNGKEVNAEILQNSLSCLASESDSSSSGTSAPITLLLLLSILVSGRRSASRSRQNA